MQIYGPRQGFLEALFICNNINTHPNKNFYTYLSYHSFKPLFLFFQISARILNKISISILFASHSKFAQVVWRKLFGSSVILILLRLYEVSTQ